MKRNRNKPQVTPLRILNSGDKDGECLNADSLYLLTLESFDQKTQVLQHTMAAPGFCLPRSGVLTQEYRPDIRPLHRHAQIELMYVMDGEVIQYIEDGCKTYYKGDCCILNKNVRHVEACSTDFKAIFLMLTDEFLKMIMDRDIAYISFKEYTANPSLLYQELNRLLEGSSTFEKEYIDFRPAEASCFISDAVEALFVQMLEETTNQKNGFLSIVIGSISRLFALLGSSDHYLVKRESMHSSREDYLYNRVLLYIRKSKGQIDYEELEKLMYYSRDYLNRIVKKRSGKTLGELAKEICLEEAALQLKQTTRSVSEIIHELGYTNRSYFYRIFQEKYGVTPLAYRKMNLPAKDSKHKGV